MRVWTTWSKTEKVKAILLSPFILVLVPFALLGWALAASLIILAEIYEDIRR